jgi:hypothetical protein
MIWAWLVRPGGLAFSTGVAPGAVMAQEVQPVEQDTAGGHRVREG